MSRRLVLHFARFGPYHFTRMRSAEEALGPAGWEVSGLQTAGTDATYGWDQTGLDPSRLTTVFPGEVYERIPAGRMRRGIREALDRLEPDAVAIPGWGTPDARAALAWCRRHGATAIVMSETRAADGKRRWWREWLKARLIRRFDGALVGGKAHREYLVQMGMPAERIETGYDVVDNGYFQTKTDQIRSREKAKPAYFLALSRFVPRKNLDRLVDAFTAYRRQAAGEAEPAWDLVLLGDGDGREELERRAERAGTGGVVFPGFRQIDDLPRWYAGAGAFVHPAREEPWGLVVNEAMAGGLPVLCSRTTGAAELIEEGVNGFLFDPLDTGAMTGLLTRLAAMPGGERRRMGEASREILARRMPTAAFGLGLGRLLGRVPR